MRQLADDASGLEQLPERRAHIEQIRHILKASEQNRSTDEDALQPSESTQEKPRSAESRLKVGGSHGLRYDLGAYLSSLRKDKKFQEDLETQSCHFCNRKPENPWITSCYHIMCAECIYDLQQEAANRDRDATCPSCGERFHRAEPVRGWDSPPLVSDTSDEDSEDTQKKSKKRKRGSEGKKSRMPKWLETMDYNIVPSAKTLAIKAQLLNWFEAAPNDKVLIFSQFHAMIAIIERVCMAEGYEYLTVSISVCYADVTFEMLTIIPVSRTDVSRRSTKCSGRLSRQAECEDSDCVSQDRRCWPQSYNGKQGSHCGTVGYPSLPLSELMLTCSASVRWFNYPVEEQAVHRCFRIGQTKETYLTRFAVANSIDESLIQMQEAKGVEIGRVMESPDPKLFKLPMRELLSLFGEVKEDERTHRFIIVEDKENENPHPEDEMVEQDEYLDNF